jgi:hypothetical protein
MEHEPRLFLRLHTVWRLARLVLSAHNTTDGGAFERKMDSLPIDNIHRKEIPVVTTFYDVLAVSPPSLMEVCAISAVIVKSSFGDSFCVDLYLVHCGSARLWRYT